MIAAAPVMVPASIDQADRILRANPPASWPKGREAQSAIRWAYDSLLEHLDMHARLLNGSLDWEQVYDPDRGLWEASEDATIDAVAALCLELAVALERRIGEYRQRQEAQAA
jgi:hypothetical protein